MAVVDNDVSVAVEGDAGEMRDCDKSFKRALTRG